MPEMNGFDLISNLRKFKSKEELPVIALSGESNREKSFYLRKGFSDHLLKPYKQQEILRIIARILDLKLIPVVPLWAADTNNDPHELFDLGTIKSFVGELCTVYNYADEPINCEVVGFKDKNVILMPLGELAGVAPGCRVVARGIPLSVKCSNDLLGKVLDGIGNPIDDEEILGGERYNLSNEPTDPMKRPRIKNIMPTGIRAIDGFLTCGEGQRIGIFAGSGVGKSTTLGMMARTAEADVNVIALIGERGREVLDFIERDLGEEGMKKSVVVCATSDKSPLVRLKGALTATSIAEYFRDKGKKVILMMDSVTRFAMAQREVGLAIGEPPAQKGYTPSVFALLPKLMERSGMSEKGSITAFYTVLVDGDDFNEPIADTVRGILDGHIVLSRDLTHKNHYPAIDI